MFSEVKHFFVYLLAISTSSLEKCLFRSFPCKKCLCFQLKTAFVCLFHMVLWDSGMMSHVGYQRWFEVPSPRWLPRKLGTGCVYKFLRGSRWRLGLIVGVSQRGNVGKCSPAPSGLRKDHHGHVDAFRLEARCQAAACQVCSQTPSRERLEDGHVCLFPLHWALGNSHDECSHTHWQLFLCLL